MKKNTSRLLKKISLIVYDFDGVMTDNRVLVMQDGKEAVFCNRSDGWATGMLKKINIPQIIISTEENPVVTARARKLKLPVMQAVKDKRSAVLEYCKKHNLDLKRTIFIGNDTNDKEAMQVVGIPCCPADAQPSIKKISSIILNKKGGEGAIRELADMIVKLHG